MNRINRLPMKLKVHLFLSGVRFVRGHIRQGHLRPRHNMCQGQSLLFSIYLGKKILVTEWKKVIIPSSPEKVVFHYRVQN